MAHKYVNRNNERPTQLRIEDSIEDADIPEILHGDYDTLWLYWGHFERMAEIASQCKKITDITIQLSGTKQQDVSWLSDIPSAKIILLEGKTKGTVNFDNIQGLEWVNIPFSKATQSILTTKNPTIKTISLSSFKKTLFDFDTRLAEQLNLLGISSGNLTNLDGLERFNNIKTLVLDNMRKLTDITHLKYCQGITTLGVYGCNNIENLEVIKTLTNLEDLTLEIKELASLDLLPKDSLKEVSLGTGLHILDNDVMKFLDFPQLEQAIYRKKKDYQYSAEELNPMLKKYKKP